MHGVSLEERVASAGNSILQSWPTPSVEVIFRGLDVSNQRSHQMPSLRAYEAHIPERRLQKARVSSCEKSQSPKSCKYTHYSL